MYVDTSCLGSYYIEEVYSSHVQNILLSVDRPAISLLTEIEFHSLINKKVRMGELSTAHQSLIINKFNEHLKSHLFEMLIPTETIYHTARWILRKSGQPIRTLDSLHLGIALTNRYRLLTTDKIMLDAAKELGIETIEI